MPAQNRHAAAQKDSHETSKWLLVSIYALAF